MSELPTGTITFLFTDIEGSTRLWEEHADGMQRAVSRHDEILRSAIEQHGGYVFSTAGDSFAAAFQAASNAVGAAFSAQRELARESQSGFDLAVRMAVHTGEAQERDGNYFGETLNRGARLLAAGYGGQILVSRATGELITHRLPDGAGLIDLGEHRLRDLTRPERIYQVIHPHLAATFPALHTLDATRSNLPIQLTSFVGRDQEMTEVQELLRRARLVTLTGVGGSGKTRLALQVAAEMVNQYRDGVWFVDLAPLTDPGLVASEVALTVGVEVGIGHRPLLELLIDYLRQRRMLVILDNCEHLIQPAAALAAHLVRHTELVTVLATSREHLAVTGETTYPVPPLSTPADLVTDPSQVAWFPAVRLFTERAQAVRRGFEVTDANAAAVAHVCSQLAGLPLALELAAARLRLLTPAELAARLDHSFSVLGSGGRDVPLRQLTLEGTLDWSFNLLTREEQALFVRLSVFAGGWTLEAAEQICSGDGIEVSGALGLMFGLADKSLVVVGENQSGTRYRLLEPLRQYALGKLGGAAEEESVRRRHGEFFTDLATESFDQMYGENEISWLKRLEAEHDNLRLALDWCLDSGESQRGLLAAGSLYRFWSRHHHDEEGYRWLNRMLDADETPTLARARALLGAGNLAPSTDPKGAFLLDEAIELLEQKAPTSQDLSAAWSNRAFVASNQEDWATAINMHEANLERARQQGDSVQVTVSAGSLAELVVHIEGELERGTALTEEALEAARLTGSPGLLARAWMQLGSVRMRTGDLEGAASALYEARNIEDRIGEDHLRFPGHSLRWLGVVAFLQGDLNQATDYVGKAIRQLRRLEHLDPRRHAVRECLQTLACIEAARPRSVEAAVLLGAAESARLNRFIGPYASALVETAHSTALRALGPDAFHRAFAEGSAMTFDEAIDFAARAIDTSQNGPDHRST